MNAMNVLFGSFIVHLFIYWQFISSKGILPVEIYDTSLYWYNLWDLLICLFYLYYISMLKFAIDS